MTDEGRHQDSHNATRGFTISPTGFWSGLQVHAYHTTDSGLAKWIAAYLDPLRQVTDFGCGTGGYLAVLSESGFRYLLGVEGDVPAVRHFGHVIQGDLTRSLGFRPHGDVICLEVAEHVPPQHESAFLDNVCGRVEAGGALVMSWAVRGQCGDGHVNCRNNDEVVGLLAGRGLDLLENASRDGRAAVAELEWFRNTLMVFRRRA